MYLRLLPLALLALLAACGGGDGSQTDGVSAMAQTTHLTTSTANGELDGETNPDEEESSIKPIYRDDNMYIDLQLGLVNLRAVELVKCESTAQAAARTLLNFVIPTASAHSAHIPSGPAGVIDVLKPDLLVWDLGELHPIAGDYCGIRLEIANVTDDTHNGHDDEAGEGSHAGGEGEVDGEAEVDGEEVELDTSLNMAGKAIVVSPCYYPDTANTPQSIADSSFPHDCIEAAYSGDDISAVIPFAETVSLDAEHRSVHLMLATAYDTWFNGLNMDILADDADEQAKLAQNVLNSFYLLEAK